MDIPLKLLPVRVSEDDFRSCDSSNGEAVLNESSSESFILEDHFLILGSNYFIGELRSIILNDLSVVAFTFNIAIIMIIMIMIICIIIIVTTVLLLLLLL